MTKWNAQDVIDSLINGQFKQAKQMTLEGLTDTYFEVVSNNMEYQTKLLSVGSEDLENAFKELASRICSVMIHLNNNDYLHEHISVYRKLFE